MVVSSGHADIWMTERYSRAQRGCDINLRPYLISHEVFLYIFDALLMFWVMVLFTMVPPERVDCHDQRPGLEEFVDGYVFA